MNCFEAYCYCLINQHQYYLNKITYDILNKYNIKKQSFHGGAMNGVCSCRLLDNIDPILEKIRNMMNDKLDEKVTLTKKKRDLLTDTLEEFHTLFEVMDIAFAKLRILDPTPDEIESTEVVINLLEKIWRKLQLSITPKCHIMFDHIMDQVREHNDIADLIEDYIEHAHQTGKQLDHLVARMK